jgi:hypothetical protein
MSRTEILSNIYCPATTPPTPQKFHYLPTDRNGKNKILILFLLEISLNECGNYFLYGSYPQIVKLIGGSM